MKSNKPMEHPLGVALTILVIAISGRAVAAPLHQLRAPQTNIVTATIAQHLPSKERLSLWETPLNRDTLDICLKYANALAGCFIENNLFPTVDWRTAPIIATAAEQNGITVEAFGFEGSRLLIYGQGTTQEECTVFAAALEDTRLFPLLELEWVDEAQTGSYSFQISYDGS